MRSNFNKLIESFGYMTCLTVCKFHDFLVMRSMYDNEKTPSLRKSLTFQDKAVFKPKCFFLLENKQIVTHLPIVFKLPVLISSLLLQAIHFVKMTLIAFGSFLRYINGHNIFFKIMLVKLFGNIFTLLDQPVKTI